MKHLIFFTLILSAFTEISAISVKQRQDLIKEIERNRAESFIFKTPSQFSSESGKQVVVKDGIQETRALSSDQSVKIRFSFPEIGEDADWEMSGPINLFNEEGLQYVVDVPTYDEDWNPISLTSWECDVPRGVLGVMARFCRLNDNLMTGREPERIYIVEPIELSDGMVIELRPEESDICLTMRPTLPDGEIFKFPKVSFNEDWSMEILEPGNIDEDMLTKSVLYKGNMISIDFTWAKAIELIPGPFGYHDPYSECNYYVNDISPDFSFRAYHMMEALKLGKGVYCAVTEAVGSTPGIYTNGEYTHDDSQIIPTPAFSKYPPADIEDGIKTYRLNVHFIGSIFARGLSWDNPVVWNVWNSAPNTVNPDDKKYYAFFKSLTDMEIPGDNPWNNIQGEIKGPYIFPFAEEGPMMCQYGKRMLNITDTGDQPSFRFPGNSSFASLVSNTELLAGESAPLLTSYIYAEQDWETDEFIKYFTAYYTGRIGEELDSDVVLCSASLKVNGEDVASSYEEIQNWMIDNPKKNGQYEVSMSTDNFELDGLQGGNRATVTFTNPTDDNLPPSVTFLQFRAAEGKVRQVFKNSSDGEFFISAADFKLKYTEPNEYGGRSAYCELLVPCKVKVSVNPTGDSAGEIEEIEVVEDPDKFYSPGFGAFYRGSLSAVSAQSPTGWFDMTISVEDEAGNRQVQTLSPAFKIESLKSEVSSVGSDRVRVVGNSIVVDGAALIYNLAGQPVDGRNLPSGVYFVVMPEGTHKLLVR